jgi:RNA methyltransferase, TrmH family
MIGARHPALGRLRRLSRQRSARTEAGAFVIDGPTLLSEALDAGVEVVEVVAEPDAPADVLHRAERAGAAVHRATAGTLARVAGTVTPRSTAAVARLDELTLDGALAGLDQPELVLLLVAINDPGNAGTLVRSADAAGVGAVVFSDDSVDPYNPKCVRGSAGSLFRLPAVRSAGARESLLRLGERGIRRIGAVARDGRPYDQVDLTGPTAIVVGSEAHGLADALRSQLDELVTIPMRPPVESLNVGMAGTLLCFEALRQRRERHAAATPTAGSGKQLDDAGSSGASYSAA